jgi:hypothetical protein
MNNGRGQTILEEMYEENHTLRSRVFDDILNCHESRQFDIKHIGITDETGGLSGSDAGG